MRNLSPMKVGDIVRVMPNAMAKVLFFGRLLGYGEEDVMIGPLGNDGEGNPLSIQGIDPGVDGITSFSMRDAIITLVNSDAYVMALDQEKLNKILGQMK